MSLVYKLLADDEWREAQAAGSFAGSAVDHVDGYIHFSGADQLGETARRHFQGKADLVCLEVDADALGEDLRWEPSRGSDLFPHLYAALSVAAVRRAWRVPLGADGAPSIDLPTT